MPSKLHRRDLMKIGAASAAALPSLSVSRQGHAETKQNTGKLPLTISGYPYERVRAIESGDIAVDGCDVTFEASTIGEMNQHIFSGPRTRDVTEVGFVPYMLAFCNGGFRDYEVQPIFVLKVFRHKSIFIRKDRGINKPEDLRGRRVATVGYSSSGLTWVRGILQDEYGVKPEEIQWVLASKDSAKKQTGGASKWETLLPEDVQFARAQEGKSDSDLLIEGDVDAIFHPAEPQAYVDRHPLVERLFSDSRTVERKYYAKTGIFPIMHLVAIRKDLVEAEPWLRKAVFDAYCRAKQHDYDQMRRIRWAYSSLPWFGQEFNETVEQMGVNFYAYGISENRKCLDAALRYLHRQGLSQRQLEISDVFHNSTLRLTDESSV